MTSFETDISSIELSDSLMSKSTVQTHNLLKNCFRSCFNHTNCLYYCAFLCLYPRIAGVRQADVHQVIQSQLRHEHRIKQHVRKEVCMTLEAVISSKIRRPDCPQNNHYASNKATEEITNMITNKACITVKPNKELHTEAREHCGLKCRYQP